MPVRENLQQSQELKLNLARHNNDGWRECLVHEGINILVFVILVFVYLHPGASLQEIIKVKLGACRRLLLAYSMHDLSVVPKQYLS